jgi:hypothetical protein
MPPFLIPLLLGLAPKVAEWVAGKPAAQVVEQVSQVAKDTLGIENINDLESAIAKDPEKALQFKLAMINAANEASKREHEAEMAVLQANIDEIKTRLNDVQSARNQTIELAKSKSPIAWGAVVVSFLVLVSFGAMMYITAKFDIPVSQKDNMNGLLWTLNTLAVSVVSYWVGSSASSAQKTSVMEMMAKGKSL